MTDPSVATGRRKRATRLSVRLAERLSTTLITVGGVGTILAVTLICVFLVWVVTPLFGRAGARPARAPVALLGTDSRAPLHLDVDEYRQLAAILDADGVLRVVRLATGELVDEQRPFGEHLPSAASFGISGSEVAFGFADGSVRLGTMGFTTTFLPAEEVDPALAALAPGAVLARNGRLVECTRDGKHRESTYAVELGEPIDMQGGPILRLDHSRPTPQRTIVCTLDADGRLVIAIARERKNLLTGKVSYVLDRHELPLESGEGRGPPDHLLLSDIGHGVMLAWRDGRLLRLDARDPQAAVVAEVINLVGADEGRAGVHLTALGTLVGKSTLLVGDSSGRLRAWFRTRPEGTTTADGLALTPAHELLSAGSPIVSLACSPRSRMLVAGHEDGSLSVVHVTTEQRLVHVPDAGQGRTLAVALAPKEDGLLALHGSGLSHWDLSPAHPEATLASLFRPVWYEGYDAPAHVWQSSSGTDEFEPKLGLLPLVFGTLKATVFSLLFGAPLAILAALFTSEFLGVRLRTPVKSLIELMASLPSVVLGFLAALVIAPFAQEFITGLLALFLVVPLCLLLGAYGWQLLPQDVAVTSAGFPRLAAMLIVLAVGVTLAFALGPVAERVFFAGDLELWLDGQRGSATGGWLLLLLPLSGLLLALVVGRLTGGWFRRLTASWSRGRCARADLVRFVLAVIAALLLAWLAARLLTAVGADPRGGALGTYVQRNALVVGFVMGFAIIPIIYTLAEDALSSVPQHLRQASLGAGATPWQTAVRVIVPTATSGLFSALMIGLGRAVGETMIVLMATGNTPVMDWNVFNGFRTLSANIAVELPEAVQGSTHYRTLFLAALVLFAMTFVLNTVAEIVRMRFRKRAFQL